MPVRKRERKGGGSEGKREGDKGEGGRERKGREGEKREGGRKGEREGEGGKKERERGEDLLEKYRATTYTLFSSLVLLPTIGSSAFLRFQLRVKMKRLEADDKVINTLHIIHTQYIIILINV